MAMKGSWIKRGKETLQPQVMIWVKNLNGFIELLNILLCLQINRLSCKNIEIQKSFYYSTVKII